MPIFIPVDIMEDLVESVAQKISGSFVPGGTGTEALQGWILKFGEDIKKLHMSVEIFVDWISNNNLTWTAYRAFMSGRLIELDKQPGVHMVGVGETWRCLFAKCVLKVVGPEATNACQYDQLCAGLKAVIDGVIHNVQYIWGANPSM